MEKKLGLLPASKKNAAEADKNSVFCGGFYFFKNRPKKAFRMKNALFLLLFAANLASGQNSYSYINDRKFKDPSDLLGYNFRPAEREIKGVEDKKPLKPGSVSFGITRQNLYVEGEGIAGVYNVNNIDKAEYGFKLALLNARNPSEQGHLKVILNQKREVDALVFKKATKEKEIIFFQAELPEGLAAKESKFFSDKGEVVIENKDSLWSRTFRPFLRLHQDVGIQDRLVAADSMVFSFYERTEIIDKTKKKDKKAIEKAEAEAKMAADSTGIERDSTAADGRKLKIVKRHFLKMKGNFKFDDGSQQLTEKEWQIKSVSWREDKNSISEDDHFLIEIEFEKRSPVSLFLSRGRAVSYLQIDNLNYLARGF